MLDNNNISDEVFKLHDVNKRLLAMGTTFSSLLSFVLKIPLLNTLLQRRLNILCFSIGRLRQQNNHLALQHLFQYHLCSRCYRRNPKAWWFLMRLAVALAQERQVSQFIIDIEWEDKLIKLAEEGPQPQEGYDPAYTFVGQSLWLFERGNIAQAVEKVKLSIAADPNWGYSQYLMGWYGLFTVGLDSVAYFSKAVKLDWGFLQRIKRDRSCQQHPEIIRKVQSHVLISSQQK